MTELIPRITAWLDQPQHIPADDQAVIKKLAQQYPYFVPLQHLEAVLSHREEPFNDSLLNSLRLKGGNYIMLQQLLATAIQEAKAEPAEKPAAETTVQPPLMAPETPAMPQTPTVTAANGIINEAPLIQPAFTEDYFRHEGIAVADEIPAELDHQPLHQLHATTEPDKSLLVMMSFAEWLAHYKVKSQKDKEEEESRKSLRTMWQKEKLAAAMEEENEEIPEQVFEMAVNSIAHEDGLISESLALILVKQGKTDKAIEMYRKLGLRNPAKSTYFAQQIEQLQQRKL